MEAKVHKIFSSSVTRYILYAIVWAIIIAVIWSGIASAEENSRKEGVKITQDSIRKAAITCYSLEGIYPESLDYLIENYDLKINNDIYIIHYEIFASNIMPDVTVILRQEVEG